MLIFSLNDGFILIPFSPQPNSIMNDYEVTCMQTCYSFRIRVPVRCYIWQTKDCFIRVFNLKLKHWQLLAFQDIFATSYQFKPFFSCHGLHQKLKS